MKKIIYKRFLVASLIILPFYSNSSFGQEIGAYFNIANTHYQTGDFQRALEDYQKIIDSGYESGALYYNMGNCYYKLQNIGRAILYYERAKRFLQGDEDLKTNIVLANLAVVDKITPRGEFWLFRILRGFVHLLPKSLLTWIVITFYMLCVGLIILWIVARNNLLRKIGQRMSIFMGILFLITGLALWGRIREDRSRVEGIIMIEKVDAMSSPSDDEGMEVFSLHEGTKVRIDQRSGDWVEIILADGKVGWVKKEILEII